MRRGPFAVTLAAAVALAACGSSSTPNAQKPAGEKTTPASAVLTTTAPVRAPSTTAAATATTPAKAAPKQSRSPTSTGAHHSPAPAARAAPPAVPAPRFARRVSAACEVAHVPSPPQTLADLDPGHAKTAAERLARLVGRLSTLRPPRIAQGPYLNLEQTYARLKDLYGFASAARLTRSQLRSQLLPGIQATHSQAANAATTLGATGCLARP